MVHVVHHFCKKCSVLQQYKRVWNATERNTLCLATDDTEKGTHNSTNSFEASTTPSKTDL
jgi:hypothetical protein